MLVVSRKRNETMIIDDVIQVTVVDIRGDKVRLGIECPMQIPVHRKEVWDAIRRSEESHPPVAEPAPLPATPEPAATSFWRRALPSAAPAVPSAPPVPAPPTVDAAIDVLLRASARLSPEEAAAARALLEAARRRLG